MYRQKIEFTFICDDEEINFKLVKFEYGEVNFATISGNVKFHDIFDLGHLHGRLTLS